MGNEEVIDQNQNSSKIQQPNGNGTTQGDIVANLQMEPHTPLMLLRYAEFMASKYRYTPQTKGGLIQMNEDNKNKFEKIAKVISQFVDDYRSKDGLIPALENKLAIAEGVYHNAEAKGGLTEKSELFEEENIDDYYLTLEFVKNAMKGPLGKDFEDWLKENG